jgi:hypothetical protein
LPASVNEAKYLQNLDEKPQTKSSTVDMNKKEHRSPILISRQVFISNPPGFAKLGF